MTDKSLELMQTELSIQFMDGLIEFKEIKDFFYSYIILFMYLFYFYFFP